MSNRRSLGFLPEEFEDNHYIGKWVKLGIESGMSMIGKIKDVDKRNRQLCLNPTIVYEPFYLQDGKEMSHYRLEEETPSRIATSSVIIIQCQSDEYVKRILEIGNNPILR